MVFLKAQFLGSRKAPAFYRRTLYVVGFGLAQKMDWRTSKDGLIQKVYSSADGLCDTVWAGTEDRLVRLRDGRLATLTTRNGLPCNHVSWVREDDDHSLWSLLQCGLARLQRSELEVWAADRNRTIAATIFDNPDGV